MVMYREVCYQLLFEFVKLAYIQQSIISEFISTSLPSYKHAKFLNLCMQKYQIRYLLQLYAIDLVYISGIFQTIFIKCTIANSCLKDQNFFFVLRIFQSNIFRMGTCLEIMGILDRYQQSNKIFEQVLFVQTYSSVLVCQSLIFPTVGQRFLMQYYYYYYYIRLRSHNYSKHRDQLIQVNQPTPDIVLRYVCRLHSQHYNKCGPV
eukprot:TRINITY_DN2967_c0_g2_i7.p1 TRINITY_DN2967_c0_g2~~TRINITY_DN2967_c0_g2_i7.p1  ORF type:complete len:205 (-),score=-15.41 TRINITY_DN2967_c0_g2_i7:93-707(-)